MADSLFQQNLRNKVMDQIALNHFISEEVISAMKNVPRHLFVSKDQQHAAYRDEPLPIASGQTISQITTVAIQTDLLKMKKGNKVLEIGTGSGYQAAILCELGFEVYSIERHKKLHLKAKEILSNLEYENIVLVHGDGFDGLLQFAPFDGILITCGAPEIPEKLLEQLAIGGRMVVPVGEKLQEMMVVEKTDEKDYNTTGAGYFRFVPMLKGIVH
ncbi:MAG: protein-L-isoaspartate(D-aspartate) O-methyltransferase [Petrimonas sp.]|jgi:protein-L-isoaspartate(D-aspartate) O-methyltransferase|nr:MAG: Protein-L-isoaspartate O-methyltransferase [Bacteroidetes bacterium ADurb.BinA174]